MNFLRMISYVVSSWEEGALEPPFSVLLGGVSRDLVMLYHTIRGGNCDDDSWWK